MTPRFGEDKRLTVCVYLSGVRAQRAFTLLESLRTTPGLGARWDLVVGIDCISYDLAHFTHSEHKAGMRAIFIETKGSLGKDRFLFSMLANIRSRYILLLDDRASLGTNWLSQLESFLTSSNPTGIAGAPLNSSISSSDAEPAAQTTFNDSAILLNTAFLRAYESSSSPLIPTKDYTLFDSALRSSFGLDQTHAHPFDPQILQWRYGLLPREQELNTISPLLSACLCTYGDHPELILRCLDSILQEPLFSQDMEILLGCNAASERVMMELEQRYSRDRITTLIRSPFNVNKSGIQRFTFRLARGAYILSLDDDMYFKAGWFTKMKEFVLRSHPFEAAGRLYSLSSRRGWSGRKKPYHAFVERKRWWRGKQPHEDQVHFPAGQCFLVRRSFVIENDYPDLGMKIDWDDVLLGDMVTQLAGSQLFFSDELYQRIVVDEIASRGQHGGG